MRDLLSIGLGLALVALAAFWVFRMRSRERRRERSRRIESAESGQELRDRLGGRTLLCERQILKIRAFRTRNFGFQLAESLAEILVEDLF